MGVKSETLTKNLLTAWPGTVKSLLVELQRGVEFPEKTYHI